MVDDSIYKGLSPVRNLRTSTSWGRYHHLLRGIIDLTFPVGREPITDMIHLVVIPSFVLPLSGSVTRDGGGA